MSQTHRIASKQCHVCGRENEKREGTLKWEERISELETYVQTLHIYGYGRHHGSIIQIQRGTLVV